MGSYKLLVQPASGGLMWFGDHYDMAAATVVTLPAANTTQNIVL